MRNKGGLTMAKSDSVDFEHLFFFLVENTSIERYQQRMTDSPIERSFDEGIRLRLNNKRWANKVFIKSLIVSILQQRQLSIKINWTSISKEQKGLDAWM